MMPHPRRLFGLAAAFLLTAAAAQAQGHGHDKDKGHDKGHDRGEVTVQRGRSDDYRDLRAGARSEVRVDERYDDRAQGRRVPPGLAKKPGGMPPGQYKKHYEPQQGAYVLRDVFTRRGYTVVRMDNAGSSRYVYYRLRDGSVRRAVVSPGTDRLGFSNVPSSLLREVLSALY